MPMVLQSMSERIREVNQIGYLEEEVEMVNPSLGINFGPKFQNDFALSGYCLERDLEPIVGKVKFSIRPFDLAGQPSISGVEMMSQSENLRANLGQRDAEKIIKFLNSHRDKTPKEILDCYIIFTGTLWMDSLMNLTREQYVPYIGCDGYRWYLRLGWLGHTFGSLGRFLVPV